MIDTIGQNVKSNMSNSTNLKTKWTSADNNQFMPQMHKPRFILLETEERKLHLLAIKLEDLQIVRLFI